MKMKKVILSIVALLMMSVQVQAQTATVPANIKAAFEKAYANATNVVWDLDRDHWEAEFIWNNAKAEVEYDLNGNLIKEDIKLTDKELPAAIRAALNRDYAGYVISEIEKETEKGVTVYEIEFTHNGKKMEIEYDLNGNIVK